jgi:hypothetical protein
MFSSVCPICTFLLNSARNGPIPGQCKGDVHQGRNVRQISGVLNTRCEQRTRLLTQILRNFGGTTKIRSLYPARRGHPVRMAQWLYDASQANVRFGWRTSASASLRRLMPLQEGARAVDGAGLQIGRLLPGKHGDFRVRAERGDVDRGLQRVRRHVVGQHD